MNIKENIGPRFDDEDEDVDEEPDEDRMRMDPNYRWLLKDLKLSENKRVMDVTDLIDKKLATESTVDSDTGEVKFITEFAPDPNESTAHQHQPDDSEYDETNYLSKLYEKLVNADSDFNDTHEDNPQDDHVRV